MLNPEPPAAGNRTGLLVGVGAAMIALGATGYFLLASKGDGAGAGAGAGAAPSASGPTAVASAAPPPGPACPDDMVQIPAGQFFMGSDSKTPTDDEKRSQPSHNVSVDSVCMDLFEVTAKKYKECSDAGKCRRAPVEVDFPKLTAKDKATYSPLCTGGDPEKADHPITCVTWEMADNYCKANDRRLPTEAEWEFASRGPDGRVYPWGDAPPTAQHLNACDAQCLAWAKANKVELTALDKGDDGFATTAPVGKFPAGRSRFGPFDVAGNVWEWVADWYGEYKPDAAQNPLGPASGERKVIRGGAWNGGQEPWLHPSFRYAQVPSAQSHGIGFRCAKAVGK